VTQSQWLVTWAGDDQGSALEVTASGAAAIAVADEVPRLVADGFASGLAGQDATLWGEGATAEASVRLGWVDLPERSLPLVAEVERLRAELAAEGVDRVILCGMGGSSLAPEVIARTADVPLVVLDSTDPDQVRTALAGDLERTVVVISSKSGSTVETDSHRRAFEAAFTAAGITPAHRIIVVTDPGSPLERLAVESDYRAIFRADPQVGGRFSALSAFGLVPAGLAGADLTGLLDSAAVVADLLADDGEGNPALVLGAALGGTDPLRDKVVLVDEASGTPGLGDWVEQLLAESTGKHGTGLLPVVVEDAQAPEVGRDTPDVLVVHFVPAQDADDAVDEAEAGAAPDGGSGADVTVAGPLGAQFLLWEYATAVAGRLLGINPFDQPDVESAKRAARGLLDARPEPAPAALVDGAVELRGTPGLLGGVTDLPGAVAALLDRLPENGYLAVMAFLDRGRDGAVAELRQLLSARSGRPVSFGWGPRFLHSTGQLHKGGPAVGVFLQVTGEPETDLPVPDRPFGFGRLIAAQAAGDAQVLAEHGRPVLRLHLRRRAEGLEQLLAAARASAPGTPAPGTPAATPA
jgi:glucose-6-phosphate isomerase